MAESSHNKTIREWTRFVVRRWPLFVLTTSLVAIAILLAVPESGFMQKEYTGTASFERRIDLAAAEQGKLARDITYDALKLSQ
jgi:uncharacterized membrane protein YdfJ with MMPL/SSD domain